MDRRWLFWKSHAICPSLRSVHIKDAELSARMGRFVSTGAFALHPKGIGHGLVQPSVTFAAKAMSSRCRAPQPRARQRCASALDRGVPRRARRDRAPRGAALAPRIRSSSRCRTPARPNGIARIPPGSSSSSCCCRISPGYRVFDEQFAYLFNSYYVAAGPRHARPQRGLVTRPASERGRRAIAPMSTRRSSACSPKPTTSKLAEVLRILEIGLHHEQQHQELLLTDILHAFALNPVAPAYDAGWTRAGAADIRAGFRASCRRACTRIGFAGEGYCFDNEGPAHQVYLRPVRHRALARHQCAVARFHRRRRLRDAVAVALRRLGDGAGRRLGGARLLAQGRRRLAHAHARRACGRSIRTRRSAT